MNLKFLISAFTLSILLISCGGDKKKKTETTSKEEIKTEVKKDTPKLATIDITKAYMDDKGIGPIKSLKLEPIDAKLAETGKEIYKAKCTACHKLKKRYIGPALKGVTERRSPEWIMNMMLNPTQMVAENALAKALITEYNAPMADQQLEEEEALALLEFLRSRDKK